MTEAILVNEVSVSEIKEVFASYPELEYDQCFLANDGRVLVVRANVRGGHSFNTAQTKVLSSWLAEKVGEYEFINCDTADSTLTVKFKTEEVAEYSLVD